MPDKPSIAVLPFANMSDDPKQEYFSDGITDDLTTALSRLPDLFVIARTSAFTYKGRALKVQEISRELGVAYVLEGSVRKADNQVRITAQLVDATTGDHLWAEHYDRPLKDIFSLQDEIVRRIVTTLNLQLHLAEKGVIVARRTDNLEAYDNFLRGWAYGWSLTKDGNVKARQLFQKAVELDPSYADAYSSLGWIYFWGWVHQWSGDPNDLDRALQLEHQAIALDDSLSLAHAFLGRMLVYKRQYDQAVAQGERAIDLAPNFAFAYFWLGQTLSRSGRPAEAIGLMQKTERFDPRNRELYESEVGISEVLMGRYEEAIPILKKNLTVYPDNLWGHGWLAVAFVELGRKEEAQAEAAEVMRISPDFSLKVERQRWPLKDQTMSERYFADWHKAGLK